MQGFAVLRFLDCWLDKRSILKILCFGLRKIVTSIFTTFFDILWTQNNQQINQMKIIKGCLTESFVVTNLIMKSGIDESSDLNFKLEIMQLFRGGNSDEVKCFGWRILGVRAYCNNQVFFFFHSVLSQNLVLYFHHFSPRVGKITKGCISAVVLCFWRHSSFHPQWFLQSTNLFLYLNLNGPLVVAFTLRLPLLLL